MSLKNSIVSVVTAAALAGGAMTSVSTSASAGGWRHHNGGSHSAYAPRQNYYAQQNRGYRNYDGGHQYRHRNHNGAAVAAGAFAVILGLALASQAGRVQHDYYDEN
jgi:hypothetical protein